MCKIVVFCCVYVLWGWLIRDVSLLWEEIAWDSIIRLCVQAIYTGVYFFC